MSVPRFFIDAIPAHGTILRYGRYTGDNAAPTLPLYANIGRWDANLGVIVRPDLTIASLNGTNGYCWERVEGVTLIPATFAL